MCPSLPLVFKLARRVQARNDRVAIEPFGRVQHDPGTNDITIW
jgi:hypothetical protein